MKNRKLRVLGVLLVTMGVLGAVAAPALAQQGMLTTDGESVTLDAQELGEPGSGENALTAFGSKIECPGSTGTGHAYNVTPHEPIPNEATTITMTPSFINCVATSGESEFPTTVQMNGCDGAIHIGETAEANVYKGEGSLLCPEGQEVEIEMFLGGSHGFRTCTITIPPQEGTGELTVENISGPPDYLIVKGSGSGSVTLHQAGLCGAGETEEAVGHVHGKIIGTNAVGEQTGITITDE